MPCSFFLLIYVLYLLVCSRYVLVIFYRSLEYFWVIVSKIYRTIF